MTAGLLDMRLLVVDDNDANVALMEAMLQSAGYRNVLSTRDPRSVADLCAVWHPDLVLLDLHMPDLDGYGVLDRLSALLDEPVNLPVLVLTADAAPAARHRALSLGARDFITKPLDTVELLLRVHNLLHTRDLQHRLQRHNIELSETVRARTAELEHTRFEALRVLAAAAEYRDDDTHQHTQRVGRSAAWIAAALGLDDQDVDTIRYAAPLHDIGKIGVPDHILLKPGGLTRDEHRTMRRHVEVGARILASGASPILRAAADIARSHHERWDGGGYLEGLAGDQIPLFARITAVADVFDALTHDRPYKEAWPIERALEEILRQAAAQFDPDVVSAFATLDHAALIEPVSAVVG